MDINIILTIGGVSVSLTPDELKKLHEFLHDTFGKYDYITYPYPYPYYPTGPWTTTTTFDTATTISEERT